MVKLTIISFFILILPLHFFSQGYEKDWASIESKLNSVSGMSMKEVESFHSKYGKQLESNPDRAMKFHSLWAYKYWEKKDLEKARENFITSYNYALKAMDTGWKYTAVYRLGEFYKSNNNYQEAEKYYYFCMRPLSVILGQSSREYTEIFYEYTELLIGLAKFDQAKPYIDGLIYYYKTLDGENNIRYLTLMNYKAMIMQGTGDYKGAIELFTWLADGDKYLQLGDTSMHITGMNNLGNVNRETGNNEAALFWLKKAKQEFYRLKVKDKTHLATIENNLGLCYKALGRVQEAEEAFDASITLHKEIGDRDLEGYCTVLSNKGDLLRELGRLGEASDMLKLSLAIRKNYFGENSVRYANALSNLAIVEYDAGFFNEALEKNLQAEEIYRNTVGENHQTYGNCLNNLSICYLHFKDYQKAENYKLMALKIIENSVGKNHSRYANYLISTCGLYFKTRQLDKAEKNLKEAIVLVERNFGKKHDLYAHAALLLAEIYSETNRMEEAIPYYMLSTEHYSALLNTYFDGMTEDQQAQYFETIRPMFGSFNLFVMNYQQKFPDKKMDALLNRAFENQLLLKGLLNNRSARLRQQVFSSGDQQLIRSYDEWCLAQSELIDQFKNGSEAIEDNSQIQKINSLETELKKKLKDFGNKQKASLQTLKSNLAENEAALEFFRVNEMVNDSTSNPRYGVFVIKKNSTVPELVIYRNSYLLEDLYLKNYDRCIDNQWEDTLSYQAYFKPLLSKLSGVKKVYLSCEGIFHKISFSGLYDPKKKKYLEDETDICYVSNLSAIHSKKENQVAGKAVLFGDPDYEYDFAKKKSSPVKSAAVVAKRFGLTSLPELPGTKTEVEQIEKELKAKNWKTEVYLRENANEENLRKISDAKILHIATHGYYLKDVESNDDSFLGFETNWFKHLSLLRSGIILAGAGPATNDSLKRKAGNDGIVTAYEASLLNLYNTELVVLSACQTGLGDDNGSQGVAGLQRSFSIAGAKNIIMSLWPVDDQATQELMTSFYARYAESGDVEASFKLARNKVKEKYKHPYYWAAFVLLKTYQ